MKRIILLLGLLLSMVSCVPVLGQQLHFDCYLKLHAEMNDNNTFVIEFTDEEGRQISFDTKSHFDGDLDYGHVYTMSVSSDGYETKRIIINTNCCINNDCEYQFIVNLEHRRDPEGIVYAGGIYYNEKKKRFDYYLKSN